MRKRKWLILVQADLQGVEKERRLEYFRDGWGGNHGKKDPRIGNWMVWYEPTRWWLHRSGWRFLLDKIHHTTTNAITNGNKSLETPLGKLFAAIIGGIVIFVVGRYIYERAGF